MSIRSWLYGIARLMGDAGDGQARRDAHRNMALSGAALFREPAPE